MKPLGQITSPYGVKVNVYADPINSGIYLFDMDGSMTMGGIYDPAARAVCAKAVEAGGNPVDIIFNHGGGKVPKAPLPRPREDIFPKMPRVCGLDRVVDAWVTGVMDVACWTDRAVTLLTAIEGNMKGWAEWSAPSEIAGFALGQVLTVALEHLAEAEIDCLEAAAFYALAMHEEWSRAGVRWLDPFRETWFRDWIATRPAYRAFAAACRSVDPELPSWIAG